MNSKDDNGQQMPYATNELESALHDLQTKLTNDEYDPQNFDLIEFLDSNGLLQDTFKRNLPKWPPSIQKYINKELFQYLKRNKEFKQEDMQVIGDFFETALQEPYNCVEGNPPDDNWTTATNALAHELRRYYGLQENDEELPCWWR